MRRHGRALWIVVVLCGLSAAVAVAQKREMGNDAYLPPPQKQPPQPPPGVGMGTAPQALPALPRIPFVAGPAFPRCDGTLAGAMALWDANTPAPANSIDCQKAPYSDRLYVCVEDFANGAGYAYRWECINSGRSN